MATVGKRDIWVLFGLVLLGLVFFILATKHRAEEESALAVQQQLSEVTVAMKWEFAGTMSPYFAAKQNGIFDENKLSVQLVEGGLGKPSSIQQVMLKNASFGITGAHDLAVARSNDQPIVALAVIFKQSPVCLLTTTDKRIKSPVHLVGKTVEMSSGDNAEFEYLAMLQEEGIDPIQVKHVAWYGGYQGLLTGSSDAIVAYENDQPITLQAKFSQKGKQIQLICPRDYGVTPYADVLFTTESLIDRDPELVNRVVRSILQSWEWANTHVDETVNLFLEAPQIKVKKLDHESQVAVLRKSLEFVKGDDRIVVTSDHIPDIGIQETNRWNETLELLKKYGDYEKLPSVESVYTNQWVKLYEMTHEGSAE